MNSRGQNFKIGLILTLFIGAIVGIVLLQSTAQQTDSSLSIRQYNATVAAPALNAKKDLVGQEILSTPLVYNTSSGTALAATNYTVAEEVSTTDGLKRIVLTTKSAEWAGRNLNISYDYGAEGYIEDAGSRTVFNLVILFGALAIAVFLLVPSLREGLSGVIGR